MKNEPDLVLWNRKSKRSKSKRVCCVLLFLRLHFPFCVSLFPFLCIYISLEIFLAFLRKSGPQSFLIGKRFVIRWRQWIYAKPPPTTQHKYKYNNKQAHKSRIQIASWKLEMYMSVISQNNEYVKSLPAMLLHTRTIYCQTSKAKKRKLFMLRAEKAKCNALCATYKKGC